jgi:hypothetical protein
MNQVRCDPKGAQQLEVAIPIHIHGKISRGNKETSSLADKPARRIKGRSGMRRQQYVGVWQRNPVPYPLRFLRYLDHVAPSINIMVSFISSVSILLGRNQQKSYYVFHRDYCSGDA